MKKLATLKKSGKLRKKTDLRPKIRNDTRWSSTYSMLKRYFDLQNFLDLADRDTADLLPGPSENFKLRECLEHLQKFESVSKKLQRTTCTKKESRILFDALLSQFPELSQPLGTQGVIECPTFERAVYKFQMNET